MQVVSGLWAIESSGRRNHHRRGKYVQAVAIVPERHANGVEGPANIDPIKIAKQTLLPEIQVLTARAYAHRALVTVAKLQVSEPYVIEMPKRGRSLS